MNTVNVLEIPSTNDMSIGQLVAFPDNKEGNEQAEELFTQLVKENYNHTSPEEMEVFLEEGYFQYGDYYVAIVHSTGKT